VAYRGAEHPRVIETPIKEPDDWLKLRVLPADSGVLGEQLESLQLIAGGLQDRVPFVMTVFTPLAIAGRMTSSEDAFMAHLREHPAKVEYALEIITETFANFSRRCLERGASGLFFATTAFATSDRMSAGEYQQWGRPWDLKLLRALPPAELHILHVCRDNNFLRAFADYPVQAINWDARGRGNLSLAEGRALLPGKAIVGGLPHQDELTKASPQPLALQVKGLRESMGKTGWMLGTGCTFSPETPEANIEAIRRAAD
jgi:uroporphyrinogen decarboxylase